LRWIRLREITGLSVEEEQGNFAPTAIEYSKAGKKRFPFPDAIDKNNRELKSKKSSLPTLPAMEP